MASVQILNNIGVCEDVASTFSIFCLPPRVNCNAGCRDQILAPCGQNYNCNKGQGQAAFFMSSFRTDKFQFQTNFVDDFNVTPEFPDTGWGDASNSFMSAELFDENGTISTDVTAFTSRRIVAHNGNISYQIIEIDVALIEGLTSSKCWKVAIYSHDQNGAVVESLCTQDFTIEETCESSVLIGSTLPKSDCCESWYDDPKEFVGDNFRFDNTLRYRASIDYTGGSNEKTIQRVGSVTRARKVDITEVYEIKFADAMPKFLAKQLHKVHLSGVTIEVDGESYNLDEFTLDNALKCNFNFPVEVYRFCENKFNC